MCRMTDTGARWRRAVELPEFGKSVRFWAVPYNNETRYVREPTQDDGYMRRWLKPVYAIRVTARNI